MAKSGTTNTANAANSNTVVEPKYKYSLTEEALANPRHLVLPSKEKDKNGKFKPGTPISVGKDDYKRDGHYVPGTRSKVAIVFKKVTEEQMAVLYELGYDFLIKRETI